MNLQIVSNTKSKSGKENFTNEFSMKLVEPIDAENQEKYIEVLNVSYPLTTKNVLDKKCSFQLEMKLDRFIYNPVNNNKKLMFIYTTPTFEIPEGIYSLEQIITFMNNCLYEYNIYVEKQKNGKIAIHFNLDIVYKYRGKVSSTSSTNLTRGDITSNGTRRGSVSAHLTLSPTLRYMLGGFTDNPLNTGVVYMNEEDKDVTIYANNLPDVSEGNKIYIYCDKVIKSFVGDSKSQLLCVVPLQLKDQGSPELASYTPPSIKRKLIKSKIEYFNIHLRDNTGELINFDSGSVNIECLIH